MRVSCIMPTADRRPFIPRSIEYFLRQDYAERELVIVDDGADAVEDLIPADPRIRYLRIAPGLTLGAKRNRACQEARSPIIAHWDDDDWHAPHRLSRQVDALLASGADMCGIDRALFYAPGTGRAWEYAYPRGRGPWLSGSTLVYRRSFWERHPFADLDVGEDARFVWDAAGAAIHVLQDHTFHVGMVHDRNTSPKQTGGVLWREISPDAVRALLGRDLDALTAQSPARCTPAPGAAPVRPLHNVFACLVHEATDCVVDLVRNLRHLDPSSVILLYNGGEDPGLLTRGVRFPYPNVFIHPDPKPMRWGALHGFALDCMRFARQSLSFDTLTIVDSDQLGARAGYSARLAAFLAGEENVGLLGNSPGLQGPRTRIPPAAMAWREIELWRPFLRRFPDGEQKWVHWSFWPATVLTADACGALVDLLDHDDQLRQILRASRLWATEEILFPTLTALLGFRVLANPFSGDYVKYRADYSRVDLATALRREDVYWVHPVPRRYDDRLRRHLRRHFHHYEQRRDEVGGLVVDAGVDESGPPSLRTQVRPEPVTVVVPHMGRERLRHLETSLPALRRCEGIGEIVLCEMGSEPLAEEIAARAADHYVFVRHDGVFERARALNAGFGLARCDLVLWTDNDVLLPPDFLARAARELLDRDLDYLIPFSSIRYLSEADTREVMGGRRAPAACRPERVLYTGERGPEAAGGTVGLARRTFLQRTGAFIEGFRGWGGEDNAWNWKASVLGRAAATALPDQHVDHLYHPNSGAHGQPSTENPYYGENVRLMQRVVSVRDPQHFLREFPPPATWPCPWPPRRRIVFMLDGGVGEWTALARSVARAIHASHGIDVEWAGPQEQGWRERCAAANALVAFGPQAASLLLECGLPDVERRLVVVRKVGDDVPDARPGLRSLFLSPQGAVLADAGVEGARLIGPLSLILGGSAAEDRFRPATGDEPRVAPVPAWMYWEGPCPDWIRECQETISAHVPGVRLLTPESFDALRDRDRDIDLQRLHVAHRADFVRAFLLARYGGLWIDSDCVVMRSLRPLLDLAGEHELVGHRERSGVVSNGFMGARPGSRLAGALYRRICRILRSGRPLRWCSIGSEPLTALVATAGARWHELPCKSIQPVCWSNPAAFFSLDTPAKHEQSIDPDALCYMLSNTEVIRHAGSEPHALQHPDSFFRYLIARSLVEKGSRTPASATEASVALPGLNEPLFRGMGDVYRRFGDESVSGPGSSLTETAKIRAALPPLLAGLGVRSLLDAPCGDFNWMKEVKLEDVEYVGIDIQHDLVEEVRRRHASPGRRFERRDLLTDALPTADCILSRDALVHLSLEEIGLALQNFKRSGARYLIMTTFTAHRPNQDTERGQWRTLNFQLAPFGFPAPQQLIDEGCSEVGGAYADKCLGLWRLEDLPIRTADEA